MKGQVLRHARVSSSVPGSQSLGQLENLTEPEVQKMSDLVPEGMIVEHGRGSYTGRCNYL